MIAMVRVLIAYCAVGAACLLTGCTTVHNANAPVEIRAASTSQHSDWQKLDFYVGGLSTWVAPKPTVVCSEISSAKESLDGFGHPTVVLIFDSEGARKMAELFKQRSSRPVAIVLDGKIIYADYGFGDRWGLGFTFWSIGIVLVGGSLPSREG